MLADEHFLKFSDKSDLNDKVDFFILKYFLVFEFGNLTFIFKKLRDCMNDFRNLQSRSTYRSSVMTCFICVPTLTPHTTLSEMIDIDDKT